MEINDPNSCAIQLKDSTIKLEENKVSVTFANPNKDILKVQFDGCIIQNIENQKACDFLIIDKSVGYILVELKGSDVKGAFEQIEASLKYINDNLIDYKKCEKCTKNGKCKNYKICENFAALIVCKSIPRAATSNQILTKKFSNKHKKPAYIITTSQSNQTIYKTMDFLPTPESPPTPSPTN